MGKPEGTYEAEPIRGDLFVDRAVGWTVFSLALVVLGVAVYRLFTTAHQGAEAARILLILLSMAGALALARSTVPSMTAGLVLFGLRLLIGIAYLPSMPTDRYLSMQVFFDLGMVAYCWFRRRSLLEAQKEAGR